MAGRRRALDGNEGPNGPAQKVASGYMPLREISGIYAARRLPSLIDDDQEGLWVLVFPNSKEAKGIVDGGEVRRDAHGDCMKIFCREKYKVAETTEGRRTDHAILMEEFQGLSGRTNVTEAEFQAAVRNHILKICEESGFSVKTFDSVDEDETFLVIDLPRDDARTIMKGLASKYSLFMPYKDISYHIMEKGMPHKNHEGLCVPAFDEYEEDRHDEMQEFRPIDCIRMVETRLSHKMSLWWLRRLGVIVASFPVGHSGDEERMNKEWVFTPRLKESSPESDFVRQYFGEAVAFFFRWLEFYTYALVPLIVIGIGLCFFEDYVGFDPWGLGNSHAQVAFSVVVVAWAAVFNEIFVHRSARDRQRWGMEFWDPPFVDRATYRIELEDTYRLLAQKALVLVVEAVYMLSFVYVIYFIKNSEKEARLRREMDSIYLQYGSTLVVASIQVFAQLWRRVAVQLVELENRRTYPEADDALARKLAYIQIFVALWNFIYVAFIRKNLPIACAGDSQELASKIWHGGGTEDQLKYLEDNYMYRYDAEHDYFGISDAEHAHFCLHGCFPSTPEESARGMPTNCDHMLRGDLRVFFMVHIVQTIVFLLIPIVMNKLAVWYEVYASGGKQTSRLQVQAKRNALAPYEFNSWGGSRVEDFMQFAISFAILTCFGILWPPLTIWALVANVVEYKLLAYRMVNTTCRPSPKGESGIGAWLGIFQNISRFAIVVNTGLAVFQLPPMRHWPFDRQLATFVVLEHAMLLLQSLIDKIIPDKPHDVATIEDYNSSFKLAKQWQHYEKRDDERRKSGEVKFADRKSRGFETASLRLEGASSGLH